jgi:hypothetical protein
MKQRLLTAERFGHNTGDPWRWRPAQGTDIQAIVDLIGRNYEVDGAGITDINPVEGSRNLMFAIVNQMYAPKKELISVAELVDGKEIVAFTWAVRDIRQPWSTEEMVVPKLLSVELTMSNRCKTALCVQAMLMWERWAQVCEIKTISSSTMRLDWEPLMKLHAAMDYTVRGSNAYKRMSTVKFEQATGSIILPR